MNRRYFRNLSIVVFASFVLLALVQGIWVGRLYREQLEDFTRRVEALAYKAVFQAFRMDAIPGLGAASQIRIDLEAFALQFEPALLEQGLLQTYAVEIIDRRSASRVVMRSGDPHSLENPHHTVIEIDDDGQFALRLAIEIPYHRFWLRLWGVMASSVAIVLLLGAVLIYLVRTMFRQRTLEEMRRDFTHNITHELKTPLSVAITATDAIRNFSAEADIERRSRYLEIIESQLSTLSAMVEQILSVSVEGRTMKCKPTRIDLRELIDEVVEGIQLSHNKRLSIHTSCPQELHLRADSLHLRNLITTLIDNAIKYGGEGVRIDLAAQQSGSNIFLRVTDNGPGIPASALPHLFEKFYRVPTGDIQRVRGYGLGLFYAHRVVEAHGGTIEASSRLGEGTTMLVTLPAYDA